MCQNLFVPALDVGSQKDRPYQSVFIGPVLIRSRVKRGNRIVSTHLLLLLPFLEKILFGASETQLFPRSTVDLLLYLHDKTVAHRIKISAFWDVLPNQLIGILYSPFLPRAITVRKIDGSS